MRPTLDDARAAGWTMRAIVRCRRSLRRNDVPSVSLPPSGHLPPPSARAVRRILRGRRDQCLSNALIAQAWRADHGDPVDVVVGVTAPGSGFSAHAWLADAADAAAGHTAIYRIPPRAGGAVRGG